MIKILIAIAAATVLLPASAWANDDDYSLELHPAACKAATARIVEATGSVADTDNPLAQPGFAIFEIPGDSHIVFSILWNITRNDLRPYVIRRERWSRRVGRHCG